MCSSLLRSSWLLINLDLGPEGAPGDWLIPGELAGRRGANHRPGHVTGGLAGFGMRPAAVRLARNGPLGRLELG